MVTAPGREAIIMAGDADGSRWMVGGIDRTGWQYDEFPTIHDAVEAATNPQTRAVMLARTEWARQVDEARRHLERLQASPPPSPAGAIPAT